MAEYLTATSETGSKIHAVAQEEYDDGYTKWRTMCGYYVGYCAKQQEFIEGEETNCRHCSAVIRARRSAA